MMLNVSETKIYRWVEDDEVPFVMIHRHPMFHRVELLEWAVAMELPVSVDLYEGGEGGRDQPFSTALERGGGRTLAGSLGELAADLPIERAAEREVLRAVIAARGDELFIRRVTDRILVPRARSPIICPETPPMVMLWWCGESARKPDRVQVSVVFLILAPTIKQHLQLLSRLSLALHDEAFGAALQRPGAFDRVVAEARRWEQAMEAGAPAAHETTHGTTHGATP